MSAVAFGVEMGVGLQRDVRIGMAQLAGHKRDVEAAHDDAQKCRSECSTRWPVSSERARRTVAGNDSPAMPTVLVQNPRARRMTGRAPHVLWLPDAADRGLDDFGPAGVFRRLGSCHAGQHRMVQRSCRL
jgi:hypothetical protein